MFLLLRHVDTMIKRSRDMAVHLIVLTVMVTLVDGQLKCLDLGAPFTAEPDLSFCSDYSEFGCCSSSNDDALKEHYEYIHSQATTQDWENCHGYVKEILCQKCSPYAAVLYDAVKLFSEPRVFPSLCEDYCLNFYDQCKNLVWFIDPVLAVTNVFTSKTRFCDSLALESADLCYPNALTSPPFSSFVATDNSWGQPGCLCLQEITDSLANPLWAGHAGDDSGRLFVAEQRGRVLIYNTRTQKWNEKEFMDLRGKVAIENYYHRNFPEGGILGIAFHPDYSTNGRFFVYTFLKRGQNETLPPEMEGRPFKFHYKIKISEFLVSGTDPDKADLETEKILLEIPQPFSNHNGGQMMFTDDGYLYAFIGDGANPGDPMRAGQNKSLLLGSVIRIDVDSDPSKPYTIPPDNPFVGEEDSRPEIYAYGVRNIWRCGLDRGDRDTGEGRGRILCGDVGQSRYEEVDLIKKGGNYGWPSREGFECYYNDSCGKIGPEELPITAYDHSLGASVTGGVFYRGCQYPALNGQYIYGDFLSGRMWSLNESEGVWTNTDVNLCGIWGCFGLAGYMHDRIMSFGEDEDGEIYLLTSKRTDPWLCNANVYKVVDPSRRRSPNICGTDSTSGDRVSIPARNALWETAYKSIATITDGTSSLQDYIDTIFGNILGSNNDNTNDNNT